MAPDQTYEDFLEALKEGDIEIASHRLDDLANWVSRGGFIPKKLAPRLTPTHELARLLKSATAVLLWAAKDLATEGDIE
jgi:hypothetical protein